MPLLVQSMFITVCTRRTCSVAKCTTSTTLNSLPSITSFAKMTDAAKDTENSGMISSLEVDVCVHHSYKMNLSSRNNNDPVQGGDSASYVHMD
jgi:hypothetical protein